MTGSEFDFWLLDLDGTLVDIEQSYIHDLFERIGMRLDTTFSHHEAECLWYGYGNRRAEILADREISQERFWEVFHETEQPQARAAATHLYPDAEQFVPDLTAPVGLVTHCQQYLTEPVLARLDIQDWFDTVVCCTDETGWKPDPRPVELAMQDLGVGYNGHVGAMAGDDPGDVGAARNAGIRAIQIERGQTPTEDQIEPDRTITEFTELRSG